MHLPFTPSAPAPNFFTPAIFKTPCSLTSLAVFASASSTDSFFLLLFPYLFSDRTKLMWQTAKDQGTPWDSDLRPDAVGLVRRDQWPMQTNERTNIAGPNAGIPLSQADMVFSLQRIPTASHQLGF